jgi:hypothetical protein
VIRKYTVWRLCKDSEAAKHFSSTCMRTRTGVAKLPKKQADEKAKWASLGFQLPGSSVSTSAIAATAAAGGESANINQMCMPM